MMKVLAVAISGYILGLLSFYISASFESYPWVAYYFIWAKIFDCGILFWSFLYYSGNEKIKKLVRWLYAFSIIRLLVDVQSLFTGIGVNNEPLVAICFVCLIIVASILLLKDNGKPSKWLSKHLNI